MELRQYALILLRSWWIIVPLTLISLTGALIFSYSQTPIYETTSSYVSKLQALNSIENTIFGIDTLTARERIFTTYCQVMTSQSVRQQAYQVAGIDPTVTDMTLYNVRCNVLPESNVLMLIVEGPSTALITRLNEAIGLVGMGRANSLYNYFALEQLDPVMLNPEPIFPNHRQSGVLGGLFGAAIGISVALMVEHLRSPLERLQASSIRSPLLGVYNERYFRQRLTEEINRSRIRHRPLSVAVLRLIPDEDFALYPEATREMLLRQAALWMQDRMREGDIIASLKRYTFGILLAETSGDEARSILTKLHAELRAQTFQTDEYPANFVANSGIVESSGGALNTQAMLEKAMEALQEAERAGENTIRLLRASPRPFVGIGVEPNGSSEEAAKTPPSRKNLPFDDIEMEEL